MWWVTLRHSLLLKQLRLNLGPRPLGTATFTAQRIIRSLGNCSELGTLQGRGPLSGSGSGLQHIWMQLFNTMSKGAGLATKAMRQKKNGTSHDKSLDKSHKSLGKTREKCCHSFAKDLLVYQRSYEKQRMMKDEGWKNGKNMWKHKEKAGILDDFGAGASAFLHHPCRFQWLQSLARAVAVQAGAMRHLQVLELHVEIS